jgi:LPS-assembly protein
VTRKLPPRRLLAVAAALALIGPQAGAETAQPGPATTDSADTACPLGTFHCEPRPPSYAMCRPNAMLDFYDPTLSRDPSLRETSPTSVLAQHVDSSDQSVYHLSGDVKLDRADQQLQADNLDYNNVSTDYDARGNVRYQEAGQLLSASHMQGNTNASHGIAHDVSYQMLDARGNGVAEQGQMFDAQRTRYTRATYSTCDVGHHVWEFRAKSIAIDKTTGVGVARNATMRMGKVPFLYLPYISFPVNDQRKSGFLYPVFGKSSRGGFELSTPYYLNLAPNYDATLDPRIYTARGPMLGGEFRYLFPRTRGQFNVQYVPDDRGERVGLEDTKDTERYLVNFSNVTRLGGSWRLISSINRASDSGYYYDYGEDLATTGAVVRTLSSNVSVRGSGKWWSAAVGATVYQNVNPFVTDASLQYRKLPYATFSMDVPLAPWLEFGMDTQAVAFRKPGYIEGEREDLYPYLAAYFGSPAWFVRPKLAYRYTAYQLDGDFQKYGGSRGGLLGAGAVSQFTEQSPTRALPIVSIDSGLVFDRSTSLFGNSYTQTLEPRLYYLYVPYRNQDNLPLFDTRVMSFDYWQLFSPNQFSGADRQMDANNLTAALTSRLLDENGVERMSVSLGQIHYFSPQRVIGNDWVHSAYVAQLGLQLSDRWRLNSSYQWSPNSRMTEMGSFELQRRVGDDGILNLSYHYRRNLLEQYGVSGVYPLSDRWRLVGAVAWSVPDGHSVEAAAGVQYDSCCVALRLVERNYVKQSGYGLPAGNGNQRDNAIMFEIVFKGLGSSGHQIDSLLQRDILGYQ